MEQKAIEQLIEITIWFQKGLVNEFGESEYEREKLIGVLKALGYNDVKYDEDGIITDYGQKDSSKTMVEDCRDAVRALNKGDLRDEGQKLVVAYVIEKYNDWLKGESGHEVAQMSLERPIEYHNKLDKDIKIAYVRLLEVHIRRARVEIEFIKYHDGKE